MARNEIFEPVGKLTLPVTNGTASGAAVMVFGKIPGVCLTAEGEGGNAEGFATVAINPAWVFDIPVKGEDGAGNAAITAGDTVARDTDGEFNKDTTNGAEFGIALEAVSSGATTTIRVLLLPAQAA